MQDDIVTRNHAPETRMSYWCPQQNRVENLFSSYSPPCLISLFLGCVLFFFKFLILCWLGSWSPVPSMVLFFWFLIHRWAIFVLLSQCIPKLHPTFFPFLIFLKILVCTSSIPCPILSSSHSNWAFVPPVAWRQPASLHLSWLLAASVKVVHAFMLFYPFLKKVRWNLHMIKCAHFKSSIWILPNGYVTTILIKNRTFPSPQRCPFPVTPCSPMQAPFWFLSP